VALALHPAASACGKVIVVGEHAVVYGYPAVAAGVPAGVRLTAAPLPDPGAATTLKIPSWALDLAITPDSDHPVARATEQVLGYCDGPVTGWAIEGHSDLPPGGGLGSSAALTVALARLVLGPDADPALVVEASLAGERVFHGDPSGIDSEVAARGGVLRFVRGEPVETIPTQHLPLCVIPSGIERRTDRQVAGVRARRDRHPTVMRQVLEAVAATTTAAIEAIKSSDLVALGELMDINHGLLVAMGVSSAALDELCSTARSAGALGAKLTGAGGGGCVLCVPPPDPAPLMEALRARGLHPLLIEVTE
jgi:mevalonate kinase